MPQVNAFFEKTTSTLTYVVWDETSRDTVVIDPVLDYDAAASKTDETSVREIVRFIRSKDLRVQFILETHAHADHLSGSQVLKKEFPQAQIAVGERIREVQAAFKEFFALPASFKTDGSQFDRLLKDGETIHAGSLEIKVIGTPGHTPACSSYLIGHNLFAGDSIFMPDYGTGRCDFPGASASSLYDSIHERIYGLPDDVKVFTGHDYLPGGRELRYMATVGEQKKNNVHLKSETAKADFVKFRTERDKTLSAPKLLLPSVQINIDAGRLPQTEENGKRYLRIPIS